MKRILAALLISLTAAATLHAQTVVIKPYVQHGEEATLGAADSKVIAWTTTNEPADFTVTYTLSPEASEPIPATITSYVLDTGPAGKLLNYRADLKNLPLGKEIFYRVSQGNTLLRAASFTSRHAPDSPIHFTVFGDNAAGEPGQRKIAYQIAQAKPEFLMNVGDNVYDAGTVHEYAKNFWPDYCNLEAADASPEKGAPLLASMPFYIALGNHDVKANNLDANPDGLAAFLFFYWPLNGRAVETSQTKLLGTPERQTAFRAAAGPRFPKMCNYSFDNGPAHFLVLDANLYVSIHDEALQQWIKNDLASTTLPWKFVFFHQPGFNASKSHIDEQRMRAFAPLFQSAHVDAVFSGHVHNYQRLKPLQFDPARDENDQTKIEPTGQIPGKFNIDEKFDGKTVTTPTGVLYVITGGGGAHLEKNRDAAQVPQPYTAKYLNETHSFTDIHLTPATLTLSQIDEDGKEIDHLLLTKK